MPLKFAASTTAGQLLASMLVNLIPDVFGATAPDAVGWGAPPMDAAAVDGPAPGTSADAAARVRWSPAALRPALVPWTAAAPGRKTRMRRSRLFDTPPRPPRLPRTPPPPQGGL